MSNTSFSKVINDQKQMIHGISVLKDNIVWVWVQGSEAVVVDPAVTEPIHTWLLANKLRLIAVLQTHHHEDHIGGTQGLIELWPKADVVASKNDINRIPFQTVSVIDGDSFSLMNQTINVIGVDGHTKNHLAYYLPAQQINKFKPALFCGDTLFGAGCGRIFEGSPKEMYEALQRLKLLTPKTKVYCAHEYTEVNLMWAHQLYPEDILIKKRLIETTNKRREGQLSLPSQLSEELETNLFLRAESIKDFILLRKHKDSWNT